MTRETCNLRKHLRLPIKNNAFWDFFEQLIIIIEVLCVKKDKVAQTKVKWYSITKFN